MALLLPLMNLKVAAGGKKIFYCAIVSEVTKEVFYKACGFYIHGSTCIYSIFNS